MTGDTPRKIILRAIEANRRGGLKPRSGLIAQETMDRGRRSIQARPVQIL